MENAIIKPIAKMHSDFHSKFGIPRQSGLVEELTSTIVFEPEYRNADMLRGLEGYSHLWLIWQFSANKDQKWSPTVRPPRLGGNTRMGVFATRSPFRPNYLGLSCVKLIGIEQTAQYGTVIYVGGADLMNGTPIFDIKPYVPYADCKGNAIGGFTDTASQFILKVDFPAQLLQKLPREKQQAALALLTHDPRPSYHDDAERIYGLTFSGFNIRFQVKNDTLTVVDVTNE